MNGTHFHLTSPLDLIRDRGAMLLRAPELLLPRLASSGTLLTRGSGSGVTVEVMEVPCRGVTASQLTTASWNYW